MSGNIAITKRILASQIYIRTRTRAHPDARIVKGTSCMCVMCLLVAV